LGPMASEGFGSWHHLAGRFFGALSPAGPPANDEAWARAALLEGERALWARMSGPDRRHAVGVAREAIQLLGYEPPREVVAAALLHDVGKVESSLGTFARVGVTLAAMTAGRKRLLEWAGPSPAGRSLRARVGLYLAHDRVGAELLESAGSHDLTVTWTREHHLPPARWTVDSKVAGALKAADGD
jgi:HD domain